MAFFFDRLVDDFIDEKRDSRLLYIKRNGLIGIKALYFLYSIDVCILPVLDNQVQ